MKKFDVTVNSRTNGTNAFGETETLGFSNTITVDAIDSESAEMGVRLESEARGVEVLSISVCEVVREKNPTRFEESA